MEWYSITSDGPMRYESDKGWQVNYLRHGVWHVRMPDSTDHENGGTIFVARLSDAESAMAYADREESAL